MEAFYGRKRDEEVKTAAGSVVAYELWRETGEQKILDEIEAYNRIDCISSAELHDWKVSIRQNAPWPKLAPDASDKEVEEDADTQDLSAMLKESGLPPARKDMPIKHGLFHQRADTPAKRHDFEIDRENE